MQCNLAFINLSRRGCDIRPDEYLKSNPRPHGKELPPKYGPLIQLGSPRSLTILTVNHEYTVEEAGALSSYDSGL